MSEECKSGSTPEVTASSSSSPPSGSSQSANDLVSIVNDGLKLCTLMNSALPSTVRASSLGAQVDKHLTSAKDAIKPILPVRVALFGATNAGKTSLINSLVADGYRILPSQSGLTSRSMVMTEIGLSQDPTMQEFEITIHIKSTNMWSSECKEMLLHKNNGDAEEDDSEEEMEDVQNVKENDTVMGSDQSAAHIESSAPMDYTFASHLINSAGFQKWLSSARKPGDRLKAVYSFASIESNDTPGSLDVGASSSVPLISESQEFVEGKDFQSLASLYSPVRAWLHVGDSESQCVTVRTKKYEDVATLLERISVDHVESSQKPTIESDGIAGTSTLSKAFPALASLLGSLQPYQEVWPLIRMISVRCPASVSPNCPSNVTFLDTMGTTGADLDAIEQAIHGVFAQKRPTHVWLCIGVEQVRSELFQLEELRIRVVKLAGMVDMSIVVTQMDRCPEQYNDVTVLISSRLKIPQDQIICVSASAHAINCNRASFVNTHEEQRQIISSQFYHKYIATNTTTTIRTLFFQLSTLSSATAERAWKIVQDCFASIESTLQAVMNNHQQCVTWSANAMSFIKEWKKEFRLQADSLHSSHFTSTITALAAFLVSNQEVIKQDGKIDSEQLTDKLVSQFEGPRTRTLTKWISKKNGIFKSRSILGEVNRTTRAFSEHFMSKTVYNELRLLNVYLYEELSCHVQGLKKIISSELDVHTLNDDVQIVQFKALMKRGTQPQSTLDRSFGAALVELQASIESTLRDLTPRMLQCISTAIYPFHSDWTGINAKPTFKKKCASVSKFFASTVKNSLHEAMKEFVKNIRKEPFISDDMVDAFVKLSNCVTEYADELVAGLSTKIPLSGLDQVVNIHKELVQLVPFFTSTLRGVDVRNIRIGLDRFRSSAANNVVASNKDYSLVSSVSAQPKVVIDLELIGLNDYLSNSAMVRIGSNVVLFRGLFPVDSALIPRNNASVSDSFPRTGLFVHEQHLHQWMNSFAHVSAFAVNEWALRTNYAWRESGNYPAPDINMLTQIGQEVRDSMVRTLRNSDGEVPTWWNSKQRRMAGLWRVYQQRYSNNDELFMHDWHTFSSRCQPIPIGQTPFSLSEGDEDYYRMKSWSWADGDAGRKFQLTRSKAAPRVHANPHVSCSKNLTHALRYAAGFKSYVQGDKHAVLPSIYYGSKDTLGSNQPMYSSFYDPSRDDPAQVFGLSKEQSGRLLGMIVIFMIPHSEFASNYVVDVRRECEQGHMNVGDRVKAECEVSVYGFIDPSYVYHRWPLFLLPMDDASIQLEWNAKQEQSRYFVSYGLRDGRGSDRQGLIVLQEAIRKLVAARFRQSVEKIVQAERKVREVLATLAQTQIIKHFQDKFNVPLKAGTIALSED